VPLIVTLNALVTLAETALNPLEICPADIVTPDGTWSAALLLVSFTAVAAVTAALR
jgi:hypothetical protein